MKHIFLTGERQVGKSTLWRNVLGAVGQSPAGFVTRPYDIEGERKGHYMHSLLPCEGNNRPISVRGKDTAVPILSSFEDFGALVLQESQRAPNRLILMDELGILEEGAKRFQAEVFACLNGSKRVLGVLKKADAPFLEEIRSRKDTLVLELTKDNREERYGQLLSILQER